jgi:hypothetical protein
MFANLTPYAPADALLVSLSEAMRDPNAAANTNDTPP